MICDSGDHWNHETPTSQPDFGQLGGSNGSIFVNTKVSGTSIKTSARSVLADFSHFQNHDGLLKRYVFIKCSQGHKTILSQLKLTQASSASSENPNIHTTKLISRSENQKENRFF